MNCSVLPQLNNIPSLPDTIYARINNTQTTYVTAPAGIRFWRSSYDAPELYFHTLCNILYCCLLRVSPLFQWKCGLSTTHLRLTPNTFLIIWGLGSGTKPQIRLLHDCSMPPPPTKILLTRTDQIHITKSNILDRIICIIRNYYFLASLHVLITPLALNLSSN